MLSPSKDEQAGSETPWSAPWERRHEIGFFRGLWGNIWEVIARPTAFFSRLRYDSDRGALLYCLLVYLLPAIVAAAASWLTTDPEEAKKLLDMVRPQVTEQMRPIFEYIERGVKEARTIRALLGGMLQSGLGYFAYMLISAGLAHLVLMARGVARGGWVATFKVFAYSSTPGIFLLLPGCGGLVALTWAAALEIIGLAKAHRTTVGTATVAVIGPELLLMTCCTFAVVAGIIMGIGKFLS